MHFVHIEDFFHPDAGYQLNSLAPLQAKQGHRVTIVTAELDKVPDFLTRFFGKEDMAARDALFTESTGVEVVRLPLIGFYSGRAIFYPSIFAEVSKLKPDVAFVHGEDTVTGMVFIWRASTLPYPLVLDCHMLEMASKNRFRTVFRSFYRRFVTPVILKEEIPLIRVVDSNFVEKCLGIPLEKTTLLSFGTDTSKFSPDPEAKARIRDTLGLDQDSFVVMYVGKLDEHKGGKILSEALSVPIEQSKKIEFLVVGSAGDDYSREVDAELQRSPNRVVRLPTQKFSDLPDFYRAADLVAFPKQCSMSFFEAQSCGVPILFESNEINNQRVAGNNAFVFEPGDPAALRDGISRLASVPESEYATFRAAARKFITDSYDYATVAERFSQIMISRASVWQGKRAGAR